MVEVQGMDCEGCAKKVAKALESVKGVSKVEVDLEKKRAIVSLQGDSPNEQEKIKSAIRKAGYLVGDVFLKA
ncbi:MAG: heavy metal-associated domain-containing protein [Candidatus Parvarchaeota archaeon]